MSKNFAILVLAALAMGFTPPPTPYRPQTQRDRAYDDFMSELSDLRQKINNYTAEREILEERISQQEVSLESVKNQLKNSQQMNDELSKGKVGILEKRVISLEKTIEGLVSDIHQFKTYSDDTTTTLNQFKTQISGLEDDLNTNISHLKKAIESLMKASKKPPSAADSTPSSSNIYRVKSGDSLERIARANGLTVDKIKKLNNLTTDRIYSGQQLKLTEE